MCSVCFGKELLFGRDFMQKDCLMTIFVRTDISWPSTKRSTGEFSECHMFIQDLLNLDNIKRQCTILFPSDGDESSRLRVHLSPRGIGCFARGAW